MFSPTLGGIIHSISPYVPPYVSGRIESSTQWAISKIPEPLVKIAQAPLGKRLMGVVSHTVGMTVGSAFPTVSISYATGNVYGRNAGIGAGLATFALGTALSYMTTGDASMASACSFLLTSAGTIAGGMVGLNLAGQEVQTPTVLHRTRVCEVRKKIESELEVCVAQIDSSSGATEQEQQRQVIKQQELSAQWDKAEKQVSIFEAYRDSYVFRTLQYCVVMGIVEKFPIVPFVQMGVGLGAFVGLMHTDMKNAPCGVVAVAAASAMVSQKIIPLTIGLATYYAKEVIPAAVDFYNRDPNGPHPLDPKKLGVYLLHDIVEKQERDYLQSIRFVGPLFHFLAGNQLVGIIDQGIATNALVRMLGVYLNKIQDPDVQNLIDQFVGSWEARRILNKELLSLKDELELENDVHKKFTEVVLELVKADEQVQRLEKELKNAIYQKIRPGGIADPRVREWVRKQLEKNGFRDLLDKQVDDFISYLAQQEMNIIGFHVADREKYAMVLKMHLFNYLILTLMEIKNTTVTLASVKALTNDELGHFYRQLSQLALTPYRHTTFGKVAEDVVEGALCVFFKPGENIENFLALEFEEESSEESEELQEGFVLVKREEPQNDVIEVQQQVPVVIVAEGPQNVIEVQQRKAEVIVAGEGEPQDVIEEQQRVPEVIVAGEGEPQDVIEEQQRVPEMIVAGEGEPQDVIEEQQRVPEVIVAGEGEPQDVIEEQQRKAEVIVEELSIVAQQPEDNLFVQQGTAFILFFIGIFTQIHDFFVSIGRMEVRSDTESRSVEIQRWDQDYENLIKQIEKCIERLEKSRTL